MGRLEALHALGFAPAGIEYLQQGFAFIRVKTFTQLEFFRAATIAQALQTLLERFAQTMHVQPAPGSGFQFAWRCDLRLGRLSTGQFDAPGRSG